MDIVISLIIWLVVLVIVLVLCRYWGRTWAASWLLALLISGLILGLMAGTEVYNNPKSGASQLAYFIGIITSIYILLYAVIVALTSADPKMTPGQWRLFGSA